MRRSAGRCSVDKRSTSRSTGRLSVPVYVMMALVGLCLTQIGVTVSAGSASGQSTVTTWSDGRAPDLAIVVQGDPVALPIDIQNISAALRNSTASNFAVVPTSVDTSVIYINSAQDANSELLRMVEDIADANSTDTSVTVLGSGVADVRLRRAVEREALLAVGLVALVTGAILALLYGWQVGVGIACGFSASAVFATILGSFIDQRFNGSVLSTNLPAIVASLIVVVMMGYHTTRTSSVATASGDLRSTLRNSLDVSRQLVFPMVAVLAQLALVWLAIELLFPSTNPTLSILVGAIAGAIVGLVLVPLLVQVGGVSFDRPSQRLRYLLREHEMAQTIGIGVVALIVVVTVAGVLNSFGRPSAGSLDQRNLDTSSAAATALNGNGDFTEAIVVTTPSDLSRTSVEQFAAEVSAWPAVRLVQTSTTLAVDGSATNNAYEGRDRSFEGLRTATRQMVLVVPNGAERSNSAQQLVLDLQSQDILPGLTVDARRLDDVELERRGGWLLVSVVFLSCLGGVLAAISVGGESQMILTILIVRLFLLLGVIGIGSLLVATGTVDEILMIVLAVVLVLAWLEVSYWTYKEPGLSNNRSLVSSRKASSNQRMRTPMRSSSAGLTALAAVGAAWMFADAPFIRPMGMALVVIAVVVAAAINVLLPSLSKFGSIPAAGQSLLPRRSSKVMSLAPAMLAFATQPFGRQRFRPTMPSRLRPFVQPKTLEESVLDGDEPGSGDDESEDIEVEADKATVDDGDEPGSGDDESEDVEVEADKATVDESEDEAPEDDTDETTIEIDGFSDLTVAGEGGFAVVYKATGPTGSVVAIKVLTATSDANERRRFDREKDALKALSDVEGVVELLGSGETDTGAPYLVLTYLDGGTVARRIRTRPINWHEAYELGCKLAETLAVCHRKGVFHRDLKPSNVLLDDNDEPYLLDFGSTQIVDGRSVSTRSAFTPNYCPPEVLVVGNKGSDSGLVDVYGLGILLWSMVAGRRPFVSEDSGSDEVPTVFNRVATQKLDPLVGVPTWFKDIVEKAIEKSPSKRFGSVAEMHTALVTRSLLPDLEETLGAAGQNNGEGRGSRLSNAPKIGLGDLFARRQPTASAPLDESKPRSKRLPEAPLDESKPRSKRLPEAPVAVQAKPVRPKRRRKRLTSSVDWSAEASRLILADFELASSPGKHNVDEVYFPGTEVYEIAQKVRSHYIELGHQIVGDKPMVLKVDVINKDAPIRLEVVVAHPSYILLDGDGNELQTIPFERRRSDLWLVETEDGYRISTIVLRTSEQDDEL